jgi:hypothetical protein
MFIGVEFQPLSFNIQKGKNPRGLGTSPLLYKKQITKKSHPRKVALKSWFEDLPSDNLFFLR